MIDTMLFVVCTVMNGLIRHVAVLECPYCSKRPSTPSEALYFEQERSDIKKDWRRRNYQHKNDGKNRHMRNRELYDDIHSRKKI